MKVLFLFVFLAFGLTFSKGTPQPIQQESVGLPKLNCSTERFYGKTRAAVKTSAAQAEVEKYANLEDLLKTLPTPDYMRKKSKLLGNTRSEKRVEEENRNVTIKKCYIYFMKREPDNDYHIIVGSQSTLEKSVFFNIEVSGLPDPDSIGYAALDKARKQFQDKFGPYCFESYQRYEVPVEVSITGSLFYDIGHGDGVVGPKGYRPPTSWEIHPVTAIDFRR